MSAYPNGGQLMLFLFLLFLTGIAMIIIGNHMDKAERRRRDEDPYWYKR